MLYPINNTLTRSGLILSLLGLWLGGLYFGWRKKLLRLSLLTLTTLGIIFLAIPGRSYDRDKLRQSYVDHLRSYEGTHYVWGGENKLGLDCSGFGSNRTNQSELPTRSYNSKSRVNTYFAIVMVA